MIIDQTPADYKLPMALIKRIALEKRIDAKLIAAIIIVESGGNQFAQQYQPNFHYFYNLETSARIAGHTYLTERVGQATSHGLMQIMGATARNLGFEGPFGRLYDPEINLRLGSNYINQLQKKYESEADVISAYNMGTPRKDQTGLYLNQYYVDRILKEKKGLEIWF